MSFDDVDYLSIGNQIGLDQSISETLFNEWRNQQETKENHDEDLSYSFEKYLLSMTEEEEEEEQENEREKDEKESLNVSKKLPNFVEYSGSEFKDHSEKQKTQSLSQKMFISDRLPMPMEHEPESTSSHKQEKILLKTDIVEKNEDEELLSNPSIENLTKYEQDDDYCVEKSIENARHFNEGTFKPIQLKMKKQTTFVPKDTKVDNDNIDNKNQFIQAKKEDLF